MQRHSRLKITAFFFCQESGEKREESWCYPLKLGEYYDSRDSDKYEEQVGDCLRGQQWVQTVGSHLHDTDTSPETDFTPGRTPTYGQRRCTQQGGCRVFPQIYLIKKKSPTVQDDQFNTTYTSIQLMFIHAAHVLWKKVDLTLKIFLFCFSVFLVLSTPSEWMNVKGDTEVYPVLLRLPSKKKEEKKN